MPPSAESRRMPSRRTRPARGRRREAYGRVLRFAGACALLAGHSLASGCEGESKSQVTAGATQAPPAVAPAALPSAPEPVKPPEIIVDGSTVSIGNERLSATEQGLADKVAVLVVGRPAISGQTVDVVAMRNAKPSRVAAVVSALRRANAGGVHLKTEARDGTTQDLPLSFPSVVADCTTAAWIAKDAAIDVWPAGGGTAKRIIKGMAGPDMTLGIEAVERQAAGCGAAELVVGADDRLTWGLAFDLGTMALRAPGTRVSRVVLVTSAVPGRKLSLDAP
jgi:hypothetical protein